MRRSMENNTTNENAPFFSMKHVFVLLSILLGFYLNWSYVEVSVLAVVVWVILSPAKSWQLARISLIYFVLMSIFILYKTDAYALEFAMGANLFLVLTVLLLGWESKKTKNL